MINFLLIVNNPEIVRSRDRSLETENKRQIVFEVSINREPFQFERVKMKVTMKNVDAEIAQIIHRADFASGRGRNARRTRDRVIDRGRDKGRGRDRRNDTKSGIGGTKSGRGNRSGRSRNNRDETITARRERSAELPGHPKTNLMMK